MVIMRKNKRNKGAAVLELALVIMTLFLLTFGIIEYGWLFLTAEHITHVAREAARTGCVKNATNADVADTVTTTMTNMGLAGMIGYVSYPNPDGYPAGTQYQVNIIIPVSEIAIINEPNLIPLPDYLRASVSMMKE